LLEKFGYELSPEWEIAPGSWDVVDPTAFFKGPRFRVVFKVFFFLWVASFVLLGVLGAKPVEYPYSELSVFAASYYFIFLLLFM
jgi:quinol-cytochrome oxidoreductase complex cytochrome b subunit